MVGAGGVILILDGNNVKNYSSGLIQVVTNLIEAYDMMQGLMFAKEARIESLVIV